MIGSRRRCPTRPPTKPTPASGIVDAAAARFRKEGLAEVGVASLMNTAGLTHGGFYSHFESKDDLVRATLTQVQHAGLARWKRLAEGDDETAPGGIEAVIRWYLSPQHRDFPEAGCMTSCVIADLPRLQEQARSDFAEYLATLVDYLASLLPEGKLGRRETAMALYSGMLGALQLARATNDAAVSDELLEAGVAASLRLVQL